MKNNNTVNMLADVSRRLKNANISFYKIAQKIDEPKSTIQNLFSGQSNYAEERVKGILERIDTYLNELKESDLLTPDVFEDPELYIKLFALGLDSKGFTPDEKYKIAFAYKKLTDSKT